MDWLTFKFCVLIWVLCVSISKSQSQLLNSTSSMSSQFRSNCEDGQPVVPPDQCNSCICFAGQIFCTNIPCPEQDCVSGVDLPQPDACNKCICRRGKVICSNMICIPAPHCADKQLYPAQNKCNACMCLNGFITCTSNPCAEEPLPSTIPTTTTKKPKKKKKKCTEGDSLPGPNECLECFCQDGRKRCKFICNPVVESRFGEEPECVPGQHIPRPDDCNNCICFEGKIHCTHLPCQMDIRIGPECSDDQPVYRPDECNECYCFEGRLECSDLVCIRGSKCVQGQVIPKPDSCNACKCVEGHILCTDYQCPVLNTRNALTPARSSTEVSSLDECQEGAIISPPPPPNDCNTCYCMNNRILCTMINCEGSDPEIKGRLRDPNERTDLEMFDKKISVEPFIDMLSKNHEKLPAKLIHTHAYNGFHQEIKVHASHLPKDATKLLKVLATTLDNSGLASISQRLLSSSNSLQNNHDSKLLLDHQVAQTNLSGKGNVLTTQSSKLITSGSQSNETILVIPNTDDVQDSKSVLPLTSKHESIWKSVSSPASIVFHNNQQLNPHSSQEEKLNGYYYDNPPSIITPIDQNNVIRNPSKFSRPGVTHMLPTKPTRNTVEKTDTNDQSIYPASNLNNVNDGKMSYAPFSQDNKQFKPIPSGFVSKREEWPHLRPYQPTLPGPTQVFNYTSSTPVFRPDKFIVIPNNNDGQQKPSQSHFIPNLSKYYANQVKPQQIQFKPKPNHLPSLNNMVIQHPPLFPSNVNQPIVAANQYKQPQFGLKPGQGSVNPLNNIGNQTDQQFKALHPIFQKNPPFIHIPNQKKRISSINDGSTEVLPHSMVPNSTVHHHANILNPLQIGVDPEHTNHKPSHSQLAPIPSIIYRNEYDAPKIIEVNPDQEQLMPHSKISYKDPEHYNPPHTTSELDHDTLIPKVRNKTRKYNTTHSYYEKHTSVTYVSEYDPTHPANPPKIVHDLNQHQNAPKTNVDEYYLPDQESQELDLTMSKVNYYLNLPNLQLDQNVEAHPKLTYYSSQTTVFPGQQQNYPLKVHPTMSQMNKYNQHDSWNITNHQFGTHPHSPSDGENADQIKSYENRTNPAIPMYPNIFVNYPHSSSQPQFIPSQDNLKKEDLIGTQSLSDSDEEPTHPKIIEHLPSPSQTGPSQNQHLPGVIDDWGSTNGFQYAHNAYKDPRQLKPVHKLFPTKLETPQHNKLPGLLDERGSADGFQYPSLSAEDLTHPKVELNKSPHFDPYKSISNPEQPKDNPLISPHSQFEPAQNQYKPGLFDNRGDKDGFQYAHNADRNPTHLKPMYKLLPLTHSHTPFGPNLIQNSPEMFNERAPADGFQYPSNSVETPIQSRGNLHNPKLTQFGPTQNQHLPGMFSEHGSAEELQYPPNSAEKHPKEIIHKPPNSPFDSAAHKQLPGIYPSDSAGNPASPKNTNPEKIKQKQPHSQVSTNYNKPIPGTFDGRESPDGYQYTSNSPQNPLHQKDKLHYPSHSQFGSPQNQYLPGVVHNYGSPGSFQYPSNSEENPTHLNDNLHNPRQSQFVPSHNQYTSEVFDDPRSPGSFQYPSNSAKNRTNSKGNLHILPHSQFVPNQNQHKQILQSKQPNSPIGPTQNQNLPGMFDERGSANGFQYPSYSAENPLELKDNQHNPPHHQFGPTQNQHIPGEVDERGSADGFQYPSNAAENPTHPKNNLLKHPQSQFVSPPNQHTPGVFDDRGSADGFQYPSSSAENTKHPKQNKQIQPNSPFDLTHNQPLPGMFDERGSADGFQYPSNSAENPTHPKNNLHKHPQSQFLPSPNQHTPGVFDDRGSADGFQYPSISAENPTHQNQIKQMKQIQPKSPMVSTQNEPLLGMFDERGSTDGFQYPSNSAENPTHPKNNLHKHPQSQFVPPPNQHTPGVFDDRGSADGFQYPSSSAENPKHQNQNKQIQPNSPFDPTHNQPLPGMFDERGSADGFQYPSNLAENRTHPKNNLHIHPQSQFVPLPNQHTPGVFDDRGSADGFQYPSSSAENSKHPKQNKQIQPYSPFDLTHNQPLPGMFDERGSADGFQYPSNSAENSTHPKNNLHKHPQSQFLPSPNQHTPGVFDDRGSADGFQYPSSSAENSKHPKQNKQIQPNSPFDPTHNQPLPGMFDERGSADGFQYFSNSPGNPTHPKDNLHKHPQSQFLPSANQHTPGVFDDRGSADGFLYPSNSAENPTHPKQIKQMKQIQPKSPIDPTQNQHLPGMFDERGSANGFEYPSNSVENPTHPKDNLHKFPQSQFLPSPSPHTLGVFDDRGSTDGFQYSSNSAENAKHPKQNNHMQPKSPIDPTQNQHLPGMFDERGSADGFQYPSNSVENPTHPKNNLHKLPHSQFLPSPNKNTAGVFDNRGSANGFQYPSNSAENAKHPKQNNHIQPKSPVHPTQNQHLPGMFDKRGSSDDFKYPSNSVENPRHPKDNLHKIPQLQFVPTPNQHTPGVFSDRGSADGFHYPSNSAEDSTHPKGKLPHSLLGPTQNQYLPGIFEERGSADGFQYPSNSAENSTYSKNKPNTTPESKFKLPQDQPKPSSLDDSYNNNNNPLRPWMHLDHDQYKPSSFDNLLNGVHNVPWSFSGDQNKDSDPVSQAPNPWLKSDFDQYIPSSFDKLFNGIHQTPWSVPNQDNNTLGFDAEITTSRSGFKPKQGQYGPSMVDDPSISNKNESTDFTDVDDNQLQIDQDISTPPTDHTDSVSPQYNLLPKLKPDSDPDSLLPTDDGKIPDYYEQLYPLFKAVKKLSDPPIDDSVHSVGSMGQLDLLPFLFPGIAKMLNYKPSQDQNDVSPVENHDAQRINPLSKLKSKLEQLPENDSGILNWLKSKFNKIIPTKKNATVTKNEIDITKIFNLLSKLTPPNLKHTTALHNVPFSGFDPEIIENIINDFEEDTLTTTSTPRTDFTHSNENRFRSDPTVPEESQPQAPQLKYPDVHIILHQPNDENDVDVPSYIETDGEINLATDMDSEEVSASMFPKMFNPRFRHRPKDQKEECGDGTQWISNCHGCFCYFGEAMCYRLPDCELRPLGEPMTCKPYSHFNMGCYTCECNGDGVAECDATDCNTQLSGKSKVSGSTETLLPIFNEFFDSNNTKQIPQYYNFTKKLPKDCPKQDLQTQYPTCERGTSWVSSCHKCECNDSGKHECIKIDDCELDVDSYGKPARCKPNSKFYPKTNSMPCVECSCNDEGNSYCPTVDYKKY